MKPRDGLGGRIRRHQAEGGTVGPLLAPTVLIDRLDARLNSAEYEETLKAVNELKHEPFISFRGGREEILNAGGMDRVRLWLMYQLQEPRFDDPVAQMPPPNLNNEETLPLVDFFLRADEPQVEEDDRTSETAEKTSLTGRISDFLPDPVSRRHFAYAALAGILVGWMSLGEVYLLRHFYRQH